MTRESGWHSWFAWHPVQLNTGDWRWLCKVQRNIRRIGWGERLYFYRA